MKPHIRRVWWEPACSFVWQMEVPQFDGSTGTLQRYELGDFAPEVDPGMAAVYRTAAAVSTH